MFDERHKARLAIIFLNGRCRVTQGPVSPDPGRDDDPARGAGEPGGGAQPDAPTPYESGGAQPDPEEFPGPGWRELPPSTQDWLTEEEWVARLASMRDEDPGLAPGEEPDPEDPPPPAGKARSPRPGQGSRAPVGVPRAVPSARRGPGGPGSARRVPGESPGPVGAFAAGQLLDVAPGGGALHGLAEHAAGPGDRFAGASDDELIGVLCALDRAEASACALKYAAVAELIRRRPEPGAAVAGAARMPLVWEEFTETELTDALAETRWQAEAMLALAHDLEVKLPGTKAAFRAGVLRESKVQIIASAVTALDPAEARAVEALVLGRAGRLTPGGLRAAIKRAVIEVAPGKARKRREEARRDARVQRWLEDSGNAALMGRELPPAEVLAADQRITWWATRLKAAGLDGDMDVLRARAYLDLLLNKDSRPAVPPAGAAAGQDCADSPSGEPGKPGDDTDDTDGAGEAADGGSQAPHPAGPHVPPGTSVLPAGFAGRLHLTITLTTLLGLAERPGEISGLGPVDPALARDLAHAAAANPKTTYCLSVTDDQGHAIGHGCARPEPKSHARPARRDKPAPPRGHAPPGGPAPPGDHDPPASRPPPRFAFTASGEHGPPGGYSAWRLSTGQPGQRDLLITLDPIALETCDHRFEARGHDPGVKLRHLAQIRHATCVAPTCRRPASNCDFEHNIPYEAGGRSCLCNGAPTCRHDHRIKQHPKWKVEQITPGTFRRTAPSGRQYTTEPTRYPI
jgi:hypothetical protein